MKENLYDRENVPQQMIIFANILYSFICASAGAWKGRNLVSQKICFKSF